MPIYGNTGSATYSVSYGSIDEMLAALPDNNRQSIGAQEIRNSIYTVWNNSGSQGLDGPTGPPGGPQGFQGLIGTGLQGAIGFTGSQGSFGYQGLTGFQGYEGPTGPSGGPQGVIGPVGPTGPTTTRVYRARISQPNGNGTEPVALVMENTSGITISWTRSTVGVYSGNFSATQSTNKVFTSKPSWSGNNSVREHSLSCPSTSNVQLRTYSPISGSTTDLGPIDSSCVEIYFYD